MIAFQHISIHWTKWDRGPRAGALRKAIPRTSPFTPPGDSHANWVHLVRYDARNDSTYQKSESWSARLPEGWDGLRVRIRHDRIADILFDPEFVLQGKLRRKNLDGLIARLPFGKRLILNLNGAADGDHQRLYSEYIIQVGYAETATLELPIFRIIDEMLPLY